MKFVKISSKRTIHVNGGITFKDNTAYDAHTENRLRVSATWPNSIIQLKQGVTEVPYEVSKWHAVKKLAELDVLTISAPYEVPDNSPLVEQYKEFLSKVKKVNDDSAKNMRTDEELKATKAKKTANLSDLAGE